MPPRHKALFHARTTLKQLLRNEAFLADLGKLDALAKDSAEDYKKIVDSFGAFTTFFKSEQELLMREGLDREAVSALEHEATTLWQSIRGEKVDKQAVIHAFMRLENQLQSASNSLGDVAKNREAAIRGSQGVFAASVAAANAKGGVGDLVLPGSSVFASVATGLFLLKDTTSEKPIFKRLVKFTRKRK